MKIKTPTLKLSLFCLLFLSWTGCENPQAPDVSVSTAPVNIEPFWENATVYFLLTDRFYNGDSTNDLSLGRARDGAFLRNFMGGDIAGITQKIEEGYFDSLGVNAIWFTPVVEQIHGSTDEGQGETYAYHGYWARDWTRLDPNFGTEADLKAMVSAAHQRGIRILMDVVLNHTGPVTPQDTQWPDSWVRTSPQCSYEGYESTVECTLVENLPDIRTGRNEPVELPPFLREKWAAEGRLDQELQELNAFFERTGYPRAPRYYLIKWVTDWVREYGIDGFRGDTAKHIEEEVWQELKREAVAALREWKQTNPEAKIDDSDFFMVGEVYGYGLGGERPYDFGDREVDYYEYGFESLINFAFKADAEKAYDNLFQDYAYSLGEGPLENVGILNYLSSHDDAGPFDLERRRPLEAATKLMLSPGAVQIYYGDETARPLEIDSAKGDANLRSFMNWDDLAQNKPAGEFSTRKILEHWRKLGRFRRAHLAVGAGRHERLQESPYVFSRIFDNGELSNRVIVGLDMPAGVKTLPVRDIFPEGTELLDYYSGKTVTVTESEVLVDSPHSIVLLGER